MEQRQIKFRAYDTRLKMWCYGGEGFGLFGEVLMVDGFSSHFHENPIEGLGSLDRIYTDIKVMQFTGLHDKNGKEIYEGDVIYSDNYFGCITGGDLDPSRRKVVFDNREAKFTLEFLGTEDYAKAFNPSGQYLCKPNCEGSFEVVGNIYDNPDILNIKN